MARSTTSFALAVLLIGIIFSPMRAEAQDRTRPPLGIGFNAVLSSTDGLGLGLRVRASAPINSDLSFAFGTGFSGFVLQGRDEASYLVDPQVSVIITIPKNEFSGTYIMGGIGAYLPFDKNGLGETGPLLHAGFGWLKGLNETTIFYEVNPALIVGETSVSIALPVRLGVIF